jgi:hypothetical protein
LVIDDASKNFGEPGKVRWRLDHLASKIMISFSNSGLLLSYRKCRQPWCIISSEYVFTDFDYSSNWIVDIDALKHLFAKKGVQRSELC